MMTVSQEFITSLKNGVTLAFQWAVKERYSPICNSRQQPPSLYIYRLTALSPKHLRKVTSLRDFNTFQGMAPLTCSQNRSDLREDQTSQCRQNHHPYKENGSEHLTLMTRPYLLIQIRLRVSASFVVLHSRWLPSIPVSVIFRKISNWNIPQDYEGFQVYFS